MEVKKEELALIAEGLLEAFGISSIEEYVEKSNDFINKGREIGMMIFTRSGNDYIHNAEPFLMDNAKEASFLQALDGFIVQHFGGTVLPESDWCETWLTSEDLKKRGKTTVVTFSINTNSVGESDRKKVSFFSLTRDQCFNAKICKIVYFPGVNIAKALIHTFGVKDIVGYVSAVNSTRPGVVDDVVLERVRAMDKYAIVHFGGDIMREEVRWKDYMPLGEYSREPALHVMTFLMKEAFGDFTAGVYRLRRLKDCSIELYKLTPLPKEEEKTTSTRALAFQEWIDQCLADNAAVCDLDTLIKRDHEAFEIYHVPYIFCGKGKTPDVGGGMFAFYSDDTFKVFGRNHDGKASVFNVCEEDRARLVDFFSYGSTPAEPHLSKEAHVLLAQYESWKVSDSVFKTSAKYYVDIYHISTIEDFSDVTTKAIAELKPSISESDQFRRFLADFDKRNIERLGGIVDKSNVAPNIRFIAKYRSFSGTHGLLVGYSGAKRFNLKTDASEEPAAGTTTLSSDQPKAV